MGQNFPCPVCGYQATQKDKFVNHQKSVHKVHIGQIFPCPECNYQLSLKSNLVKQKISVHIGQKIQYPYYKYWPTIFQLEKIALSTILNLIRANNSDAKNVDIEQIGRVTL